MCSLKEAYRLFWIVKGHIAESDQTALDSYDGYFKRLWMSMEAMELLYRIMKKDLN